jgi:hypothetical protein
MSNAKDILSRVYDIVMGKEVEAPKVEAVEDKTEVVETELAQAKTADGEATFDAEAFEVGKNVFIVTEEGNIPVPAGMYTLEEGLMISVDEGGVIVEVKKEGEEVEEVEAGYDKEMEKDEMMEPKEEMKEPKKVVKSKTEMEESYFSKIETRLSAIEENNESLKMENVKLSEENEELKKQLAETPANHTKFNPESEAKRDFQFKIGSKRSETIQDRVFNSLF